MRPEQVVSERTENGLFNTCVLKEKNVQKE